MKIKLKSNDMNEKSIMDKEGILKRFKKKRKKRELEREIKRYAHSFSSNLGGLP